MKTLKDLKVGDQVFILEEPLTNWVSNANKVPTVMSDEVVEVTRKFIITKKSASHRRYNKTLYIAGINDGFVGDMSYGSNVYLFINEENIANRAKHIDLCKAIRKNIDKLQYLGIYDLEKFYAMLMDLSKK